MLTRLSPLCWKACPFEFEKDSARRVDICFSVKLDTKLCPNPRVCGQCLSLFSHWKVMGMMKSLQCLVDYTTAELSILLENFNHFSVTRPFIGKLTHPELMFAITAFMTLSHAGPLMPYPNHSKDWCHRERHPCPKVH